MSIICFRCVRRILILWQCICILTLSMFCMPSFGFDWEKCKHESFSNRPSPGVLFGSFLSTTATVSFSSSIGPCSGIGVSYREDRLNYVVNNHMQLANDIAKGEGEYLKTLGSLFRCIPEAMPELNEILKKHYHEIYGSRLEFDPRTSFEAIELVFSKSPILTENCPNKCTETDLSQAQVRMGWGRQCKHDLRPAVRPK